MPPADFSSPLFDAVPDQRRYAPLKSSRQADIVVIGGGITGVMTAWRLAEAGQAVTLLEANHLATGDTGYTTSFITRVPDTALQKLAEHFDIETVRQVFSATTDAQHYLEQLILSQNIDCDFVRCSSFNCSTQPADAFLKKEWGVAQLADQRARFVTSETDAAIREPLAEAIRYDGEGYFNVRKFIFGLLQHPIAKKISIFEETKVTKIDVRPNSVDITTTAGNVTAKKVIVCSALPVGFPELHHLFTPVITYALAAKFDRAPIPPHTFWDTDQPYHYWRRLDDQTIILGGGDHPVDQHPATPPHQGLEQFLRATYLGQPEVTHRWSGTLFETADGLPYIGPHPQYPQQVFVAAGFAGAGMVFGTLSGMLLADAVTGKKNVRAPLFSLGRAKERIPRHRSDHVAVQHKANKAVWPTVLALAIAAVALTLAPIAFFHTRGGTSFLQSANTLALFSRAIFPLVGLYAFTLVWFQIMLGINMDLFRKLWPNIEKVHRFEGPIVFLVAWLHPMLLLVGVGITNYFPPQYVSHASIPFVYLGYLQLSLITLTVVTALLRKTRWVKTWWRKVHVLNYVTFFSIWIHSWFLGSDVRTTILRYVWITYLGAVVAATVARINRVRQPAEQPAVGHIESMVTSTGIAVAKVDQIKEGHPFCADVNGQKISVFKFGDKYYALDNVCSHAGGPLCEGVQSGNTIECPLHQSLFDITTGAVKRGPARLPQKTYPVELRDGQIFLTV